MLVAVLSAAGLRGVLVFCPDVPQPTHGRLGHGLAMLLRPPVVFGLAVTGLALTGFVAAFTYVAPMLRDLAGFEDVGVSVALVLYGLGTIAATVLASRVHPRRILDILPAPLAALAGVLLVQGALMHQAVTAVLSLVLMGASASSWCRSSRPG
jgi:DHA1 family inner membrane transport protein